VVGLSEEFFFRGMLQQLLTKRLKSTIAGLLLTSILFGLVHLPFRGFPNWRFALLAALAGIFYGLGLYPSRQHPRRHGDARTRGDHMEGVLCLIPPR
jgi:membrane protease YdiL (CAAX protease family)